jgi:hypothetical protein
MAAVRRPKQFTQRLSGAVARNTDPYYLDRRALKHDVLQMPTL